MDEPTLRTPTAEEIANLSAIRDRGLARLGVAANASPPDVASAADDLVDREQIERQKLFKGLFLLFFRDAQPIIDEVGAVWADQLVRAFGWHWGYATRDADMEPAVLSPDNAFAIFPGNYIGRMLRPPYADVTLMLMFNMIKAGELPEVSGKGIEDISDGRLRHIVPKR